jgi:hypothetical protein
MSPPILSRIVERAADVAPEVHHGRDACGQHGDEARPPLVDQRDGPLRELCRPVHPAFQDRRELLPDLDL